MSGDWETMALYLGSEGGNGRGADGACSGCSHDRTRSCKFDVVPGRAKPDQRAAARRLSGMTAENGAIDAAPPPRSLHRVEAPGQNALLRMQAVFGFVEHDRLRAVDHLVG